MNKGRLEAFTDALLAIAATVMVLELHIPEISSLKGLTEQAVTVIAYLISFLTIYAVWYAHHGLFKDAEVISGGAYILNGIWIMLLLFLPLFTGWLISTRYSVFPSVLYAADHFLSILTFSLLERRLIKDNPGLAPQEMTVMGINVRKVSLIMSVVSMAGAFIFPPISLYISGIMVIISIIIIAMGDKRSVAGK